MTYDNFEDKVVSMLKIRATNYRLTSNDISYMITSVFEDIQNSCVLKIHRQEVTIDRDIDTYDLDALYTPIGTEYLAQVVAIKNADGLSVNTYFNNIERYVYKVSRMVNSEGFLEVYDSEKISFYRQIVFKVEELPGDILDLIFNTVVEGILFYTQDALPNPTASQSPAQETNLHAVRYHSAKTALTNKLPQRI